MNSKKTYLEIVELAKKGFWGDIETFLDKAPSIAKIKDEFSNTLLIELSHFAGSGQILKKLIALGSDINQVDDTGETAITASILGGSNHGLTTLPELKILLEAGADLSVVGPSGNPPLHWAIYHNRLEHAKILLEHGADPYQKTHDLHPEDAFDVAKSCDNKKALKLLDDFK